MNSQIITNIKKHNEDTSTSVNKNDSMLKENKNSNDKKDKDFEKNHNNSSYQYQYSTFSSIGKVKNEPFENKKGLLIKKRLMNKKNKQLIKDEKSRVNKTADENYNIESIDDRNYYIENIDTCKSMNLLPSAKTICYNELVKSNPDLSKFNKNLQNNNLNHSNTENQNNINTNLESDKTFILPVDNETKKSISNEVDNNLKMSRNNIRTFGNIENINSINSIALSYDSNTYINQIKNLSSNNENPFKELSSVRAGSIALLDDSCYKLGLSQSETINDNFKIDVKSVLESNMTNISFQNKNDLNNCLYTKNSRQTTIKENDLSKFCKL